MSLKSGMPLLAVFACGALVGVLACRMPVGSALSSRGAEESRGEPFQLRLWRAGRPLQPGLSAARLAEVEAERDSAVASLREELGRSGIERLADTLADAETPDEPWCVAARVAAALERYELAPLLGAALEPPASPHRTVVARAGLHALYGHWFVHASELEPYLASVKAGEGTRLLLEASRWEERRSRERLLTELAHQPRSAAAWLADPDPEVRSGAARVLAQVFRRQDSDALGALEILVAHLEGEHEPRAFHEGLQACLEPLERAEVDQPSSTRLRELLLEIARTEGDPRSLSAAQALARIPWRPSGARDLGHLLTGVDVLGAMLRGLATADRRRGLNDPDPLVAVLAALRELCAQAGAAGLTRELRTGAARESLFGVLVDPLQEEAVRAAAAAALGPLARASDGPELAAVLADSSVGPSVKHALLGALRAILPELEAGTQGAGELLAAVAALTGASDADLRRKALVLCAEPGLEALVRGLDPSFMVERLAHEDGREALFELLKLIQRFGRPDMLAGLLALERFDALCGDPAMLEALAAVLQRLASRSGAEAMAAALRLAAARAQETHLARLRHALALAAALDDSAAFGLDPREHQAIAAWVWRVVGAGVALRDLAPSGLAFELRLLDVHLPRGEASEAELGVFEHTHLAALLRADLFLSGNGASAGGGAPAGAQRGGKPQVEAAFESAYGLAPTLDLRLLVLRDRARFRAAANECVKAMSDYRRLFEAPAASEGLLGIPDLRSAVELLGRLDEPGGKTRSATAGEACELLRRIVARRGWRSEPASVRMQDLRDWARTAVDSGELGRLRQVEAALSDLPLTQLETQAERDPPPLWFGLTREANWFQELLDLRARMRLGVRALEAQG